MGTTKAGIPYPEPTDPTAQGAAAMKAMAVKIPWLQTGTVTVSFSNATVATASVTFPVAFPGGPRIFLTPVGSDRMIPSISAATASAFTVALQKNTGGAAHTGDVTVYWMAVYVAGPGS